MRERLATKVRPGIKMQPVGDPLQRRFPNSPGHIDTLLEKESLKQQLHSADAEAFATHSVADYPRKSVRFPCILPWLFHTNSMNCSN